MAFGWGIVSTGKHPDIKIAPAIAAADGGDLVAVYSRDQDRAEAFAQKHGARAAYSRLGDLLKNSRVDGAVSPGDRFEIAVFAINGPISAAPGNFLFFREAKVEFFR